MGKSKHGTYFALFSIILFSILIMFDFSNVKARRVGDEDDSPGGVFVSLLPDPAPKIVVDTTDLYQKNYVPIHLWGVVDNSATSWTNMASIPKAGMSFIADVSFAVQNGASTDQLSAQSLKDNIDDAYANDQDSFGMVLAKYPDQKVSIDNTNGFAVVADPQDSTGQKKVLQITLRGDQESGLTKLVIAYYRAGYDLSHVEDTIDFSANKQFILSKDGEANDESPGKVNTKGFEIPSASNSLEGTVNFYNYDKCYGTSNWTPWKWNEIYLKSGATPSLTFSVDVPTWSEYISPWDSKETYNTAKAAFNEVSGVTTALPGGYLTPTIDWNLKKDGPPTEKLIAQRFGRVVNYFSKAVDKKASVRAVKKVTDDGADFTLSDPLAVNDTGILQRSVQLKTKFKAVAPSLTPHTFTEKSYGNRQMIPFTFDVLSPTSQWVQLYEAVDNADFKAVGGQIDEHDKAPQTTTTENTTLPAIAKIGQHTLYFKLIDSNGLESAVKSLPITIDQRALVTKDTEIRQYNHWQPTNNIVSVQDRTGNPVDTSQVTETGNVDTNKIGTNAVTYAYDGLINKNIVTVLKSLSTLDVKDINLTVGDALAPKQGFIAATDNDGNSLTFDQVQVSGLDQVDVKRVGDYPITYSLGSIAPIEKKVTVHVQSGTLSLTSSQDINFPNTRIDGHKHWIVPKSEDSKVIVSDKRGSQSTTGWSLLVSYGTRDKSWQEDQLDLTLTPTTEDPALVLPPQELVINDASQSVAAVAGTKIEKENQNSTITLNPKLGVSSNCVAKTANAVINWNLVEAP